MFMFDYDSFTGILKTIKSYGYKFQRFDDGSKNEKTIYIRHDVDISPIMAISLAKIENSLAIKSSFFFQIGCETYNIFSADVLNIIRDIKNMKHCVGLHIDESFIEPEESCILEILEWFNKNIADIDFVVSFHRPSDKVLSLKYNGFINTYQKDFFSKDSYVSDSRRDEKFYNKLLELLKIGSTPIQLLLHPCWWYPEKDINLFYEKLIKRRTFEVENYLKNNFNKVFGGIIGEYEDRNFGL